MFTPIVRGTCSIPNHHTVTLTQVDENLWEVQVSDNEPSFWECEVSALMEFTDSIREEQAGIHRYDV